MTTTETPLRAARRTSIVEAAADLMFAAGAADTTLDMVLLDAVGIDVAQLDRDFADRDEFVVAVLQCRIERVVTAQTCSSATEWEEVLGALQQQISKTYAMFHSGHWTVETVARDSASPPSEGCARATGPNPATTMEGSPSPVPAQRTAESAHAPLPAPER